MVKDKKGEPHLTMNPITAAFHCRELCSRIPTRGTNTVIRHLLAYMLSMLCMADTVSVTAIKP